MLFTVSQSLCPSCCRTSQELVENLLNCCWCLVIIAHRRGCLTQHYPQPFILNLWTVISFLLFSVFGGLIYYLDTFPQQVTSFPFWGQLLSSEALDSQTDWAMYSPVRHCSVSTAFGEGYDKDLANTSAWFFPLFLYKMATPHVLWVYSKLSIFYFYFSEKTCGRASWCINCHSGS